MIPLGIAALLALWFRKPIMKYYYVLTAGLSGLGKLSNEQKENAALIAEAFIQFGDGDVRKLNYILATAWHESRLMPVRETSRIWTGELTISDATARDRLNDAPYLTYTNSSKSTLIPNGNAYYGRSFVQLTWYDNYVTMSDKIGVDLVTDPDEAMSPEIAAKIIVVGMMQGLFTGVGLSKYFNDTTNDPENARRTVNGKDRALLIAGYAESIATNSQNFS